MLSLLELADQRPHPGARFLWLWDHAQHLGYWTLLGHIDVGGKCAGCGRGSTDKWVTSTARAIGDAAAGVVGRRRAECASGK
jgi:hypothetical protein